MMWYIPTASPPLLITLWYVKRGWGCDPSHYQSVGERPSSCMLDGSQLLELRSTSQSDASGNISTMPQPCHPRPLRYPRWPCHILGKAVRLQYPLIHGLTRENQAEYCTVGADSYILTQKNTSTSRQNISNIFSWLKGKQKFSKMSFWQNNSCAGMTLKKTYWGHLCGWFVKTCSLL